MQKMQKCGKCRGWHTKEAAGHLGLIRFNLYQTLRKGSARQSPGMQRDGVTKHPRVANYGHLKALLWLSSKVSLLSVYRYFYRIYIYIFT